MAKTTRRRFLQTTSLGLTGAARLSAASSVRAAGANKRIVLGMIGPGGMGTHHLRELVTRKDVQIAYVCDPDRSRLAAAASLIEQGVGRTPQTVTDMRLRRSRRQRRLDRNARPLARPGDHPCLRRW